MNIFKGPLSVHLFLKAWRKLEKIPGGRYLISRTLGRLVPYSGSISPNILALEPGYAEVSLKDRRRLRNHLHSVHAMAIANLAELTSGLAFLTLLPESFRAILTDFSIQYFIKARGELRGRCKINSAIDLNLNERKTIVLDVRVFNSLQQVVAEAHSTWTVDLKKESTNKTK